MNLDAAYAHCEAQAREAARDRWLGALFAPLPSRRHLYALIAFEAEMDRLRAAARDPRAGEIRLVWWREALTGERPGEAEANPVAFAMLDTLARAGAAPHLIEKAVMGRQFDLYDDTLPTTGDLEAYLGETRSTLLQIGALALGVSAPEASGLAGVATGLVAWLCGLAQPRPLCLIPEETLAERHATSVDFRARQMTPALVEALGEVAALARRRLTEAEAERAKLPRGVAPVFAALAAAPLRLAAAERRLARAFERPAEVAAWRRQWALWRWMRRV